jgi:hypothetical protein
MMNFSLRRTGTDQAYLVVAITSPADPILSAQTSYEKIAEVLSAYGLEIVHERIFGSLRAEPGVMAARRQTLLAQGIQSDGPVTYVEGRLLMLTN